MLAGLRRRTMAPRRSGHRCSCACAAGQGKTLPRVNSAPERAPQLSKTPSCRRRIPEAKLLGKWWRLAAAIRGGPSTPTPTQAASRPRPPRSPPGGSAARPAPSTLPRPWRPPNLPRPWRRTRQGSHLGLTQAAAGGSTRMKPVSAAGGTPPAKKRRRITALADLKAAAEFMVGSTALGIRDKRLSAPGVGATGSRRTRGRLR